MPFITQGKINWKFLLIVIILAIIVGAGTLWYSAKQKVSLVQLTELKKQAEDNEVVAFIQDGDIWVLSNDFKNQQKVIDREEDIIDFAFSSGGKEVYLLNGQEIWKRDSDGNFKMLVRASLFSNEALIEAWKDVGWVNQDDLKKLKGGLEELVLSPDGKYIAYQEIESYTGCCAGPPTTPVTSLWIMKNDGNEKVKVEEPAEAFGNLILFENWLPDSKKIIFSFHAPDSGIQKSAYFEVGVDGKNPKVYTEIYKFYKGDVEVNVESLTAEEIAMLYTYMGSEPVFSPTGEKTVSIRDDGQVRLRDVKTKETKTIFESEELQLPVVKEVLKWSEDGSLLLILMSNKLYVFNKEGEIVLETDPIHDPILSFDNKNITVLTGEYEEQKILYMNIFNKERKEFQLPKNVSKVKVVYYKLEKKQADETADWKTTINKELGVDFELSNNFIEVFGIPYKTYENEGKVGKNIGFSFGPPDEYAYTGLMFTAYTFDYEPNQPWPLFDWTGAEDVVKACPKQLDYSSYRVCKIIEIDKENAIFETSLSFYEASCLFDIRIYFNNSSSSLYKGLNFNISLPDTDNKVCKYYYSALEGNSEELKSEFYTQSKNIMENKNLSEKDKEKLELFNQMLSTFKFLE